MRYTLRALVAVGMLVGFYVLVVGVVAGLVTAVVVLARTATPIVLLKLGVPLALIALAIARALFTRRHAHDHGPGGFEVTEADQPVLWHEVRELASAVGTRPPDEIRLVAEVNAAVSEDTKLLGLVPGTRRLYLGVPLLLALSPLEMRSVLAHELGHYSGRHLALGAVTYRGKDAIGRVVVGLGGSAVGWIFRQYGRLYFAVAHTVGRRQELEADDYSARLAGSDAAASALATLPPIVAAWQYFLSRHARLGGDSWRRPEPFFGGFASLLADPRTVERLAEVQDEFEEPEASVYDTHPPLAQRIARIEATRAGPPTSFPPAELLVRPDETLAAFESALFEDSKRRPAAWEELVADGGAKYVEGAARTLGGLVATPRASLGTALDLLHSGGRLGLIRGRTMEQERATVADLVASAAAHALVRSGAATFRLSWSGPARLTAPDGTLLDPWEPAEKAAASGDTGPFRAWAEQHGVSLDLPIDPDQPALGPGSRALAAAAAQGYGAGDDRSGGAVLTTTDPRREASVLGVVAPVKARRRAALVVTSHGVVLVPLSLAERLSVAWRSAWGGSALERTVTALAERVASAPPDDLVAARGARFHPWSEVTGIDVSTRKVRSSRVRFDLAGGVRVVVRVDARAAVHGDPWTPLRQRFLVG